jgi:hypothetical protein
MAEIRRGFGGHNPGISLEKSQISVCDFSTSPQIGLGSRFAEAAVAGLNPASAAHRADRSRGIVSDPG